VKRVSFELSLYSPIVTNSHDISQTLLKMSDGAKSPEASSAPSDASVSRPGDAPVGEVSGAAVDVTDINGVPAAESKEETSVTDIAKGKVIAIAVFFTRFDTYANYSFLFYRHRGSQGSC